MEVVIGIALFLVCIIAIMSMDGDGNE